MNTGRFCVAVAALLFWAPSSNAAVLQPIAGTGYDEQMVVTKSGTPAITATMDTGTARMLSTWYELGQDTSASSTGLPLGTTFAAQDGSGNSYALQPDTGFNAFLLGDANAPTTATFNLSTPASYGTLSLLASSSYGPGKVDVTLDLQHGGTIDLGTISIANWFTTGSGPFPIAYYAAGRFEEANQTDISVNAANGPYLFENILSTGTSQPISSIVLTWEGGAGGTSPTEAAFMGFSGAPPAVPEPSSLALLLLGAIGLLVMVNRRRG